MRSMLLLCVLCGGLILPQAFGDIPNPPQGGRPYIFLTPERIAEIQAKRAANHYTWTHFVTALENANEYEWNHPEFCAANALAWKITGDAAYLTEAKRRWNLWVGWPDCYANGDGLCYQWTGRYLAWAYDWAYDGLTPEERTTWLNHIKTAALLWYDDTEFETGGATEYHTGITIRDSDHAAWVVENMLYAALALYGDDNASAEKLFALHDFARGYVIEDIYLNDFFKGGFDPVGPMYAGPQELHMLRPMIVDLEARGIPIPLGAPEGFMNFILHTTFPGYRGNLQLGDIHVTNYQPDQWTEEWTTPQDQIQYMCVASAVATDPIARNHAHYWIARMEALWNTGPYPFFWAHLWNKQPSTLEGLLFAPMLDGPPPSPAESGAPLTFVAEGGLAAMRTSWEDDAVCLWFQNTEWNVDHTHQDALHYTILRNGMPVNSELSGYWGAANPSCYHAISHNTLLIENSRGGNQTMAMPADNGTKQMGPVKIDLVDSSYEFGYIQGDAAHAYNYLGWNGQDLTGEMACENALRKIMWIKPDKFIVYDFVKTPAALGARWKKQVNHFHGEPVESAGVYHAVSDGNAFFFKPLRPAGAGITVQNDTAIFTAEGGGDFLKDQKHWTMIIDAGSGANPEEFLAALFVEDESTVAMPAATAISSGDGQMTGVHFAGSGEEWVGLMRKGPGTQTSAAYSIPHGGSATVRHWVSDFGGAVPLNVYAKAAADGGMLNIELATSPFAGAVAVTTSAQGTASFTTGPGGAIIPLEKMDAWMMK